MTKNADREGSLISLGLSLADNLTSSFKPKARSRILSTSRVIEKKKQTNNSVEKKEYCLAFTAC